MSKQIDVLSEDLPITGQVYALISIVGPNLKQKCNMYGIKIRGVADTIEKAKQMTKRIMKVDNDYDIYTVEVGKFFPLNVDPMEVSDIEYENEQLNSLVKNYLENRQQANEHYHQRKAALMKKAIQEGQKEGQAELANKKEHPISVLQRKQIYQDKLKELKDEMETLEKDLELTSNKYDSYTDEERQLANDEFTNAIKNEIEPTTVTDKRSIGDIKNEITNELNTENIENTLGKLKLVENDIQELDETLRIMDKESSPNMFDKLTTKLNTLIISRDSLKEILNNKNLVNNYINNSYTGTSSGHDSLFN